MHTTQYLNVEKLVKQRFVDVDFRVFPSAVKVKEEDLSPKRMHEMATERFADFSEAVQMAWQQVFAVDISA